ncbi:MAG: sigma-54-dependent transcriptional regulator [Bacteriovoracia bacterium]
MSQVQTILIADDESSIVEMLEMALKKWGYKTKSTATLKSSLAALEKGKVSAVLCDIKFPDGNGLEVLNRIKTLPERPPIIFMTAFGSTDAAVKAMKEGAFYYLAKPFQLEDVKVLLQRALEDTLLKKENQTLKNEVKKEFSVDSIIGKSTAMKRLFDMIERVSKTKTNILITGESGTGKELVARAIHYSGTLKNKPFVAVNCGAIPETLIESELFGHKRGSFTGAVSDKQGLFEVADTGTIFLDEVGELPMSMQVKLLRVLQDRKFRAVGGTEDISVDVRVISATNRNLEESISKGTFREDLFYRLNVINIRTPALRDRREDIPDLIEHFLTKYSLGMGKQVDSISKEALAALLHYDFPGNVRELENIMERAVALEGTSEVSAKSLPTAIQNYVSKLDSRKNSLGDDKSGKEAKIDVDQLTRLSLPVDLEKMVGEIEKAYILRALDQTGGVKKKAAALLGITFRSIRYRIAKYNIHDVEGDIHGDSEE